LRQGTNLLFGKEAQGGGFALLVGRVAEFKSGAGAADENLAEKQFCFYDSRQRGDVRVQLSLAAC
jgi:hypothetical protein